MKSLIIFLLASALLTGCNQNPSVQQAQTSNSDSQPSDVNRVGEYEYVERDLLHEYNVVIQPLWEMNQLERTWQKKPPPYDEYNRYRPFEIKNVTKYNDIAQITLENYDSVIINLITLGEQNYYGASESQWLIPIEGNGPLSPLLPVSKSVVTARKNDSGWEYLSCEYTSYDRPGYSFLSAVTESISTQLSVSEKPDLSQYDSSVVDYIYRKIASKRLITSPEDITMYDLSTFLTKFSFNDMRVPNSENGEPVVIESSILRHMTGLTEFDSYYKLSDYSVFEHMHNLNRLTLYSMNDEDFSSLKVGRAKYLYLVDADADIVDLSGVETMDTLMMQSWFSGVRGFKGCGEVDTLYVNGTRTDPRLYNPQNFPNLKTLVIDSFRDYARSADYSRLSEFKDVAIDIQLQYYACDNAAVESLSGVKLRNVYLQPNRDGSTREDFDVKLIDALQAENLHINESTDFGTQFYGPQ